MYISSLSIISPKKSTPLKKKKLTFFSQFYINFKAVSNVHFFSQKVFNKC